MSGTDYIQSNGIVSVPARGAVIVPRRMMPPAVTPDMFEKTGLSPDEQHIIVPYSLHACAVLAAHGLRAAGPIRSEYDFPRPPNQTPFEHQIATADFLTQNPRAFVFNEIGTAKTASALWAADFLQRKGEIGRVLIVSPLSTLLRVWGDEIYTRLLDRKYAILHGSREKRMRMLGTMHDYYIINPDGLEIIAEAMRPRRDITHVIVDEGAVFRNARTDMYRALWEIAGPSSGRSVWWMTGSPMPTAPTDAWAQARVINPSLVPKYFTRFRDQVMRKVSTFKWVPKRNWEQTVYSVLRPAVRYKRAECLDLPPCTTEERQIEMSPQQKKLYHQMAEQFRVELQEGLITAANEGVKLGKLLQIAGGAVYDTDHISHPIDYRPKLRALIEEIRAAGNKAIVFAGYQHIVARLEDDLRKHFSVGIVNGLVSPKRRNEVFHTFQKGDMQVLLAHPECMAHGLTLTASSVCIWVTPTDSFEHYEQANGRITRPGQTQKQVIIHLTASDVERRVYRRLKQKESMQGLLLDLLTTS